MEKIPFKMRYGVVAFIVAFVLAFAVSGTIYADEPIHTGMFNDHAVSGFDTVEYFKSGKATKGKKAFMLDYMGAEWLFASKENLETFKAAPEKYMPQYGGYCSWAMARGHTADSDPEVWKIVDGKLYLNYNAKVQTKWEKNMSLHIMQADEKYPDVVDLDEQ